MVKPQNIDMVFLPFFWSRGRGSFALDQIFFALDQKLNEIKTSPALAEQCFLVFFSSPAQGDGLGHRDDTSQEDFPLP